MSVFFTAKYGFLASFENTDIRILGPHFQVTISWITVATALPTGHRLPTVLTLLVPCLFSLH